MPLAVIYTDSKTFKAGDFIEVRNIDEYIEDESTFSLIIGKKNAEKICGSEKIKVLNKQISNKLFWIYGKMEKRSEFEIGLDAFYYTIYNSVIKTITYIPLNLYTSKYSDIKKILESLINTKKNIALITDKMAYLSIKKNVYGISFDEIEYIGISKDKIKKKLTNYGVKIICNSLYTETKMSKYTSNSKIIVPYLFSL